MSMRHAREGGTEPSIREGKCDTKFLLGMRCFQGCLVDAYEDRHIRSWHGKAAVDRQGAVEANLGG